MTQNSSDIYKIHKSLLLRIDIINIQTFLLFSSFPVPHAFLPRYFYCYRNWVYAPCSRALQKWVRRECKALLIRLTHWHCCGRWKREDVREGGGSYRECELCGDSLDSNTRPTGSIGSSNLLTTHLESFPHPRTGRCGWSLYREHPLQTSQWKMALIKPQAHMLLNYQDAIMP